MQNYTADEIFSLLKEWYKFTFTRKNDSSTLYTLSYVSNYEYEVFWEDAGGSKCFYSQGEVHVKIQKYWTDFKLVISQPQTRHRHYDLISKWIECPSAYDVFVKTKGSSTWSKVQFEPYWCENQEYQIKLKTKVKVYQWLYFDLLTNRWVTTEKKYKDKPFDLEDCTPILQSEEEVLESEI